VRSGGIVLPARGQVTGSVGSGLAAAWSAPGWSRWTGQANWDFCLSRGSSRRGIYRRLACFRFAFRDVSEVLW